jgi:hypothetical protein
MHIESEPSPYMKIRYDLVIKVMLRQEYII